MKISNISSEYRILTTEDKATIVCNSDTKKATRKQISLSKYTLESWRSELLHSTSVKHLEAVIVQFHGYVIIVRGSKITEGCLCHYTKESALVPRTYNTVLLAKVVMTVLLLKVSLGPYYCSC